MNNKKCNLCKNYKDGYCEELELKPRYPFRGCDYFSRQLEQEPKWIPVSEGLPEENKTVIASTEYAVFPEARYTEEWGWEWAYESGADYWQKLDDVTAWMPLPKPYKNEEEN